MSSTTNSMQTPPQWPTVVAQNYTPIRTLGVGGFASVVLAKKKQVEGSNNDSKVLFVAIKIVGDHRDGLTHRDIGYARRETEILKEIDHPNIMKLQDYWEPTYGSTQTAAMALSYHKGPTLESLIKHGGSLTTIFGRVVIAQIIDAISTLHSRAVIHRDIKPDNIIVTGASSKQDEIWDEPSKVDDVDNENENKDSKSPPPPTNTSWEELRKKWHVTVVDFGFARALSPKDVSSPSPQLRRENLGASYHDNLQNSDHHQQQQLLKKKSVMSTTKDSSSGRAALTMDDNSGRTDTDHHITGAGDNADNDLAFTPTMTVPSASNNMLTKEKSLSRMLGNKQMSALGTKLFSAPEITCQTRMRDIKNKKPTNNNKTNKAGGAASASVDITNNLATTVSEYGLLVDAYSLGQTFKHMMTGIPPGQKIPSDGDNNNKTISRRINSWMKKKLNMGGGNKGNNKASSSSSSSTVMIRKQKFRKLDDLVDKNAKYLIEDLTEIHEDDRLSVRGARRLSWIADVLFSENSINTANNNTIQFLDFVLHDENNNNDKNKNKVAVNNKSNNKNDQTKEEET